MPKIAHIINPAKVDSSSELYTDQPITFETMRRAKEFAGEKVEVEFFTAQFPEDHTIIPSYFIKTPDLNSDVTDTGSFTNKRRLPLIKDILDNLYSATDAEYLIYTNVDIALMPRFYLAVNEFIEMGYDAFIINRRRISPRYTKVEEIHLMYSEIGKAHPGLDCFVFHRSIYEKMILGNICIGIPEFEKALSYNMFCFSRNFKLFADEHLTFHIGDIIFKKWGDKEYYSHNRGEFKKILRQLMPHFDVRNLPHADENIFKRYYHWKTNSNFHFPLFVWLEVICLFKSKHSNSFNF